MVSLDGSFCVRYQSQDELIPPYTLDNFSQEIDEACKTAWENGRKDVTVVRLPRGLFPDVVEYRNPITRSVVTIERVDLIAFCGCAKPAWG